MKVLKLLFCILLMSCLANAQTIGDNYKFIKSKEPDGKFKHIKGGGYTYCVLDKENTYWIYFFSPDRICIALSFHPTSKEIYESYLKAFNKDWNVINELHWTFNRENGSILKANIDEVEKVGTIFYISE